METTEILSALNEARLCIESLGSELERYQEPTWRYLSTIKQISAAILNLEKINFTL